MADGFRVSKNHVAQTNFAVNDYSLLTWSTEEFDVGGKFANDGWIPVPANEQDSKLVVFGGQIWVAGNGTGNPPNYVAKIIKNGYPGDHRIAGIACYGTFPNSFVIPIAGVDLAQPGDEYKIWLFATNSAAIVDGHPAHTWWSGAVLP